MPDNMTDVVDRSDQNTEEPEEEDFDITLIILVALVCITIILILAAILKNKKKAKELAAKGLTEAGKGTKSVINSFWGKYKVPMSTIIIGVVLVIAAVFNPIKIFPLQWGIFGAEIINTSWESILAGGLGIIIFLLGLAALLTTFKDMTIVKGVSSAIKEIVKKKED